MRIITIILLLFLSTHVYATSVSIVPPSTNTDGTPLTELLGYKLYCGTSTGTDTVILDIGDLTRFTLNNWLSSDILYFCVATAYNSGGESGYSNEIMFTCCSIDSVNESIHIKNMQKKKTININKGFQ